jgi:hypothetical protein
VLLKAFTRKMPTSVTVTEVPVLTGPSDACFYLGAIIVLPGSRLLLLVVLQLFSFGKSRFRMCEKYYVEKLTLVPGTSWFCTDPEPHHHVFLSFTHSIKVLV